MRFWLAQQSNLSNWTDIINFFFLSLWPWFILIFFTSSFFSFKLNLFCSLAPVWLLWTSLGAYI